MSDTTPHRDENTDVETSDIVLNLNPLDNKTDSSNDGGSEDTVSKNQDSDQKFSMIFITAFEIYRVLMSSLLLMFVPQKCGDEQCGLSDKTFPESSYEKFVACHNYIVMSMFFVFYYLEVSRELNFINYLHTNRFKSRDNESVEQALTQLDEKRKIRIENDADMYKTWSHACMLGFLSNTIFSTVAVFNHFLDSKTITVLLTNVMFMSTKLYDVYTVSNTKKYIFLSAYLTRKVQFNDVDPDKLIGVAEELTDEE